MIVNLYECKDDKRKLNKTLVSKGTCDIQLRDRVNVINPIMSIPLRSDTFNYCYIEDLGRYYYVDSVEYNKNLMILHLSVDVLMSYKDYINNLSCTVKRSQSLINGYINDNNMTISSLPQIQTLNFPHGFNSDSIILMTIG